jgi:hypothetical protein
MLKLFGRKPKAERQPIIIEQPTSALAKPLTREQKLRRAAASYSEAVVRVLTEHRIGAQITDWYISPRFLGVGVRLQTSVDFDKAVGLGETIAYTAGAVEVIPVRLGRFIYFQFTLPDKAWTPVKQEQDWIGLGPRNAIEVFKFEDAPHTLVAGMTDSGKTVLAQAILMSLAYRHTVDELGVYLIDPHRDHEEFDGWEYLVYKPARTEAEVTRLASLAERELDRRLADNLRDEQRLLILVDEAENVFADTDVLKRLARVAKEGRKFRINLLVSTQKPDHSNMAGILPELDNRYLGKMASAGVSGIFGAGLNLHKLTSQGDFVHLVGGQARRFVAAVVPRLVLEALPMREVPDIPDDEDLLNPVDLAQAKPSHRPVVVASPEAVFYYLQQGPDNVTIKQAETALGLKRTGHYVNRQFSQTLADLGVEVKK